MVGIPFSACSIVGMSYGRAAMQLAISAMGSFRAVKLELGLQQ